MTSSSFLIYSCNSIFESYDYGTASAVPDFAGVAAGVSHASKYDFWEGFLALKNSASSSEVAELSSSSLFGATASLVSTNKPANQSVSA